MIMVKLMVIIITIVDYQCVNFECETETFTTQETKKIGIQRFCKFSWLHNVRDIGDGMVMKMLLMVFLS